MELSNAIPRKKKRVSKKNKKSWVKNIDHKDVEDFLDRQRLEERLGSFTDKKDSELFIIDDGSGSVKKSKLTKKEKARLPLKCFANLVNNCPIPDPVGQRTKVRKPEERKCRIRKSIEESRRAKGIIQHKILQARLDRAQTIKKKKREPKELKFDKDIWGDDDKGIFKNSDTAWLGEDTVKHHTGTIGASKPKDLTKKKSVLPAIENPHPGTSYNPTLKDHQSLLKTVVEKELEQLKEEAHINRCTTGIFKKVTIQQKEALWIEEMSQGLNKPENDENEEAPPGPLSINPPTSFQNKKTLKQRRKQREQKAAALARKYAKIEKKKLADLYKLKFIQKDIESKKKKEEIAAKIREKQAELKAVKTKRLSALKFEEPGPDFNRKNELRGNLRSIHKAGSLLSERFYSLQKRNILAPTAKVTRFRKAKVKRFTKPSHKIEGVDFISNIKQKGRRPGKSKN